VSVDIETESDPELRLPRIPIPPVANRSKQDDEELGCNVDNDPF
jgi:hypothetical protein